MTTTENLRITSIPATGVTCTTDDTGRPVTLKAVRFVTLAGDEARRTFTSTDTAGKVSTYRVTSFTVYEDGSIWAWAAQLTKQGQPFKNGMGVTMGSTNDMAKFYGQDVKDVVTEAEFMARQRDVDHAAALTRVYDTFPVRLTRDRDGWTAETLETITDEQAAQFTFRAEPEDVRLGEFIKIVDASGVRIGHVATATYRDRYPTPAYVICTIELC